MIDFKVTPETVVCRHPFDGRPYYDAPSAFRSLDFEIHP